MNEVEPVISRPLRVYIDGSAGSGKSTLCAQLGARLRMPCVELDALYWQPGWQKVPEVEFLQALHTTLGESAWVASGNYPTYRDDIWSRATHVIWLDYPVGIVMARLLLRSAKRVLTQEDVHGNRETLWHLFVGRESLLRYTWRTHGQLRNEILAQDSTQRACVLLRERAPVGRDQLFRRVLQRLALTV